MEQYWPYIAVAATVSSGLLVWLFIAQRHRAVRAMLEERLRNRDLQLAELNAARTQLESKVDNLGDQLRAESDGRIVAEEKASRIPAIESELQRREARIGQLQDLHAHAMAGAAELETRLAGEQRSAAEKLAVLEHAREKLSDAFAALSAEALRSNNQSFLELARSALAEAQTQARGDLEKRQQAIGELVRPVRESLEKVDVRINELEKARAGAYESLLQHVRGMCEGQNQLRAETSNLVKALRSPAVRGRWGEIQLRRVVEIAGMLDHCDFEEQQSVDTTEGRLRPDMLIRLPAGKIVVVDAKAPLSAYLDAIEARDEETRAARLRDHANQIRTHLAALSRKAYWEQFEPTPEFVVLFLPGETFFSAALEQDPALIEYGAERKVILATPTTLIALLRAVFYGWRQESLARNAKEISELGRELYKRLADMSGHLARLGRSLESSVEAYNRTVGTVESRVLASARRFKELEAATDDIEPLQPLGDLPRSVVAPELLPFTPPAPAEETGA